MRKKQNQYLKLKAMYPFKCVTVFNPITPCHIKRTVHPKIEFLSLITSPHVVQTSFIFGTQINIFLDEIFELSDPPIDSKGPTTIKAQKHSKDIFIRDT